MSEEQIGGLRVPDHLPEDMIGAAIAYADAGWYVLPIDQATKHAGSVLGRGWPHKSSRDPEQIVDWFSARNYGLALHVGRSGAVAFDVDKPTKLTVELALPCAAACYQSTRDNEPAHGHYLFAVPPGRMFGNSNGDLGRAWGEVRGANGIIVVAPTTHEKADEGGRYEWLRTGELPVLPLALADKLRAPITAEDANVSDAEINRWLDAHPSGTRPGGLTPILNKYRKEAATGSRHNTLIACLVWACKEVNDGKLAAKETTDKLLALHTAALADPKHPNGADPNRKDFLGALAWSLGQALLDPYVDHTGPPVPTSTPIPASAPQMRSNVIPIRGHHGEPAPDEQPGSLFDGNTVIDPEVALTPTTERKTDDGNANALIGTHGQNLRFCNERGRWLTWLGHRWVWQPSGGGFAREYSKDVARTLPDTEEMRVWRNKSLSALGTTNTLVQAATDPRVVIALTELDAQAWSLNTPAGVVDLHTGELGDLADHSLHTRSTTVAPDPAADRSVWEKFLAVTFNGDSELIGYMQRLVGYSATGYIGPHVLPFAYGSGGNGKGVFLEAIGKVLGDYATTGPSAFLMAKQHVGHDTEIARLSGARMVLCSEVNETDRFDEAKVKQLTGGDTLTARFMRQDFFSFTPTHHLWLMGNHKPTVGTGGRSFWRRCRLIPFLHEVPKEQEIDDLQGILARDHGSAILSWIIAGAVEFGRGGLREPESVTAATAEYASEQDTVRRFVDEMCSTSESDVVKVEVGVLAAAYARWCEEMGEEPVSGKRLSMDLANRYGVRSGRGNRRRWYLGIALNETETAPPPWHRGPALAGNLSPLIPGDGGR